MRLGQDLSPAMARFDAEHLWCGIGSRACRRSESRFGIIHFVDRTGMLHLISNVSADRRPPGAVIVSSAAGGIQFEKQRRGVLIDLTSHRFDLEVFPPSEHTCTTVTRSEAHHLTVALATLLGG